MILIPRSTGTTARLEHPYLRLRQSSPPMCSAMRESGHFYTLPSTGAGQILFSQERRGTGSSCRSEAGLPRWSPGAGTAAILAHLIPSTNAAAAWSLLLLRKDHQSIILSVELISAAAIGTSLLRRRRRRRGISQEQQPSSYLKYHLHTAAVGQESMNLLAFCTSPSHLNQMI